MLDRRPVAGGDRDAGPFEYLVVCAADGSMEGGHVLPSERWRCRNCYLQVPPVWEAFNEEVGAQPEKDVVCTAIVLNLSSMLENSYGGALPEPIISICSPPPGL